MRRYVCTICGKQAIGKPPGCTEHGMSHIHCVDCGCMPCICDRPETRTFEGGGKRDKDPIPGYSLLPRLPLVRVCARYEHGVTKYGRHNWRGGLPAAECLDRAFDHMYKHIEGFKDEDHLAAAVFNLIAVMQYEETHPELIDYIVPEETKK